MAEVVHGKRSLGGLEPYHVNTTRNLTWKEREFLYALRARDDVAEESPLDVGMSRAAGQKLTHASCLVVEDASADPVWIHTSARTMQAPAMRWVNAAAALLAEKLQYGPLDTPFWTGRTLADAELCIPRGHLRFKEHGLSAWTLQRHCRGEIQPPLPEVLRRAPLYVAAATAGLTCRAAVVAHPDGFEVILTDCENLTREILVPFNSSPVSTTFGHSRSFRPEEPAAETLKAALADALAQNCQEADAQGVASWNLLWVTPASASYLLACLEPALRWPPHSDSIMVAAKGEICLFPEAFSVALREAMKDVAKDQNAISFHRVWLKLTETRQALLIPEAFKLASNEHNFTINERDYTKVISLCGQATFWQDVCGLLENMEEMHITPTVFSCSAAISACAKGGQWQQAIVLLFEAMARVKIQPNTISYNTTISACEKGGEWQQALVLFEAMSMAAISTDVITYNAAISACGLGSQWTKALSLLEDMLLARTCPNVITCSAALSACEKHGQWQQALALFQSMAAAQISPNLISYSAAICACQKGEQWQQALSFFQAMPRANILPDLFCFNCAISSCEKGGQWEQALLLFETMPEANILADVVSYNATISACQKHGQWQHALAIFQGMLSIGIRADVISHNAAISACGTGHQWQQGLALLEVILGALISPNVISYNAAISACAKGGQWQQAIVLLFEAMARVKIQPNTISYNTTISACEKGGEWQQALVLFEAMSMAAISTDVITYNAAISACGLGSQWTKALSLLEDMLLARTCPNVITCSAALSACEKHGQWQQALALFQSMAAAQISPNVVAYNATISACEKRGQWQFVLILLESMRGASINADIITYNAAISACEKGGAWQQALMLFEAILKAEGNTVSPNVISYSAAISACEKGGQWLHALTLLSTMPRHAVRANVISYNATISACEMDGQWRQALALFKAMVKASISPTIISYSAVMSALETAAQAAQALTLIQAMPKARILPDKIGYNAAIGACEKGGQWEQALSLFQEMLRKNIVADATSYATTISACEKGGQWQRAVALLYGMASLHYTQDIDWRDGLTWATFASPRRAETGLFEMQDDEGDESSELASLRFQGASKGRSAIAEADSAPARAATIGLNAFDAPVELDLGLMDIAKQRRYIAKIQDSLAAELAMAMGVQPEDVIVTRIDEDEHEGWKVIFSANATREEMESAMAGTHQSHFPPPGPDKRVRRLGEDIRADKLSKDRRFSVLKYVNPNICMHEIERVQITDTQAWCRGLGGFTEEDTRRLASIFLSPEALHRKAYSGKGLQAQDLKRLRAAGFTDLDLRRLGLLGYGLSDDEATRLEAAGFHKDVLQRRLLSGDAFSKDEQTRLRTEGLPVERLRKLLAGAGKFSMSEKERLVRAGLSEMEVRRRLIGGEEFEEEEVERLDQVDLPLYELRRRILQDEIFSQEERLRLEVVGLNEADIQQRLEDRERFTADELFSLESAGFDPEDLHRRLHGESCFSPTELQKLALIGMSEEEIVRRLLAGEEFSDEELKWPGGPELEKGGFTLAKLIRRVFGTSNPTKEDGDLSRCFWNIAEEDEIPERLSNENMAMALQRLMGDTGLLSDEEHYRLESCGLSMEEMQRRLAHGDNFTDEELERPSTLRSRSVRLHSSIACRLESAGLSASLQRLASRETISEDERQVLESCGLPVEEIHRRIMTGEDFTEDEVHRLHAVGFPSLEDLQSAVLVDTEQKEEAQKQKEEGEVIFKKSFKQRAVNVPFASEIAKLLKNRYVSEEKLATTQMPRPQ
eukprot:symbB.v1.2.015659.t1/scaffold1177.1/size133674/2